jgi:hypothetical protein
MVESILVFKLLVAIVDIFNYLFRMVDEFPPLKIMMHSNGNYYIIFLINYIILTSVKSRLAGIIFWNIKNI